MASSSVLFPPSPVAQAGVSVLVDHPHPALWEAVGRRKCERAVEWAFLIWLEGLGQLGKPMCNLKCIRQQAVVFSALNV